MGQQSDPRIDSGASDGRASKRRRHDARSDKLPAAKAPAANDPEAETKMDAVTPPPSISSLTTVTRKLLREGWQHDPAKDPTEFVGKPLREYWKKSEAVDDETPRMLAARVGCDEKALVDLNRGRWYPDLTSTSKLKERTPMMVPTAEGGPAFVEGTVVATNYALWHCVFHNGCEADLEERDARFAFWLHRCVSEGWETGPNSGQGMVGKRVICLNDKTNSPTVGHTVHGRIVGYLPQGSEPDDFPMWHCLHDDGDDEDLWLHEATAALQRWQQAHSSTIKAKYGGGAFASVLAGSGAVDNIPYEDDDAIDDYD